MNHTTVATLHTDDLDTACQALATSGGDQVEIRLDALWPGPPAEAEATEVLLRLTDAARAAGVPLLATLRPKRQGGAFEGPEEVRLGLLVAAARAGFGAVDVESDHQGLPALVKTLRDEGVHVVVSDHTLHKTPGRDEGLLRLLRMQDARGDREKIAFPVGSFSETLRALELTHAHAGRSGAPVVTPLGGGPALRALLTLAGNRATYGHPEGHPPTVPEQPALAETQAILAHWGLDRGGSLEGGPDGQGAAGWYAVLGDPVTQSLSPRIHNAALRAAGRPERYGALTVPDSIGAVRLLATVAPRIGLHGASVTQPLKAHALAVAQADDTARAVGAANCLRFGPEGTHATNTDATALQRLLAAHPGGTVAVLGAGGAARAAIHAAQTLERQVVFTSRDEARAHAVHDALGAHWVPWPERHDIRADAWIQATPLGARDEVPLAATSLEGASHLVELVYAGGATPLQRMAQDTGLQVDDGRTHLLEQAVDAYRFWTGDDPDRTAMEEALRAAA